MNWLKAEERIADWVRPRIRQLALVPFVCLGFLVLCVKALFRKYPGAK